MDTACVFVVDLKGDYVRCWNKSLGLGFCPNTKLKDVYVEVGNRLIVRYRKQPYLNKCSWKVVDLEQVDFRLPLGFKTVHNRLFCRLDDVIVGKVDFRGALGFVKKVGRVFVPTSLSPLRPGMMIEGEFQFDSRFDSVFWHAITVKCVGTGKITCRLGWVKEVGTHHGTVVVEGKELQFTEQEIEFDSVKTSGRLELLAPVNSRWSVWYEDDCAFRLKSVQGLGILDLFDGAAQKDLTFPRLRKRKMEEDY